MRMTLRSGKYLYKPELSKSCCPQYTIRLNANEFKLTKSNRKVLSKFNRYINGSWHPHKTDKTDVQPKPKMNVKSLIEMIHESEENNAAEGHKLKIIMERSSYSDEKFALYCKYQTNIHHDEMEKLTPKRFKNFLVESPLKAESFPDKTELGYGSFHQKYVLDDKLIAVAVLDILPECVSSVYFMYDPEYSFLGLGTYSALREISLAQEFSKSASSKLHWYYMGFYIHNCPKMMYKGRYEPSYLLDPETYEWFPIESCKKLLDKRKFVLFSNPDSEYDNNSGFLGCLDPDSISMDDIGSIPIAISDNLVVPFEYIISLKRISAETIQNVCEYYAALGHNLAKKLALK